MAKKRYILLGVPILILAGIITVLVFSDDEAPEEPLRTELQNVKLPPDGQALYDTLMQRIPEVVSQIPCACCGEMLSACYEGFCPPT